MNTFGKERSREKLIKMVDEEVTKLFEQALDYAQIACPSESYNKLRSKILRVGNNCIRTISKKIQQYDIEYVPQTEEIIEFKQNYKK